MERKNWASSSVTVTGGALEGNASDRCEIEKAPFAGTRMWKLNALGIPVVMGVLAATLNTLWRK